MNRTFAGLFLCGFLIPFSVRADVTSISSRVTVNSHAAIASAGMNSSSFFRIPKQRDLSKAQYGESGADLMNHATRLQNEGGGPDGWIHGSVHATDGEALAQAYGYPKGYEGFYVGSGLAIAVPPTQAMSVIDIASDIPRGLRGKWFETYIARNVRPMHPLNILEEGTAYSWELAGIADLINAGRYQGNQAMQPGVEFVVYQLALLKSLARRQPGYLESAPEAKAVVRTNIERIMTAYNLVGGDPRWITNWDRPMPSGKSRFVPKEHIESFQKNAEASDLRQFTRECLGDEWARKVLGI